MIQKLTTLVSLLIFLTLPRMSWAITADDVTTLNYFVIYKYNEPDNGPNLGPILNALLNESIAEGLVVNNLVISEYGLLDPPNPWFYYVDHDGGSGVDFDITGQNNLGNGMYGYFSDPGQAYVLSDVTRYDEQRGKYIRTITRLFGSTWLSSLRLDLEPSTDEAPLDVTAVCNIDDPEFSPVSYEFDPGDESPVQTSTDGSFNYTYQIPGTYQAICRGYNDEGVNIASAPVTVTVLEQSEVPPVIDSFTAEPVDGYAPLSVTFTCNAHDPDGGDIESIEWYLGDSQWPELTTDNNFTFTHEYTEPGTYTAHCEVWDDDDQNAVSDDITITVHAPVVFHQLDVTVQPETGEAGLVTSNTQDISCPDDCTESYMDGTDVVLTAMPAAGYIFAGWDGDCAGCAGNRECTVTMTDDRHCQATFTPAPNEPPEITSFTVDPTSGELPLQVTVSCLAADQDGNVAAYTFNPGDGGTPLTSDDGDFSNTYAAAGSYQATCTAYDDDDASVTSAPVTVTVEEAGPVWSVIDGMEFSRSRTLMDRINHCFFVFLDITNNSGANLDGPVRMVLENATLDLKADGPGMDPDGITENGDPYFIIVPEGESLDNGQTLADRRLDFVLRRARLTFDLRFEQFGQ